MTRLKIPDDDFTDVTVAIGDTYGDDVKGLRLTSRATWWPNFQLIRVPPPGGHIFVRFGKTKGEIRVKKSYFRGDLGGF